jgi:hypothetical protein
MDEARKGSNDAQPREDTRQVFEKFGMQPPIDDRLGMKVHLGGSRRTILLYDELSAFKLLYGMKRFAVLLPKM